ncbi:hypothetical protein [Pedobacter sp. GR22-6]|uniref:hypothetical protein n=1 Tax=Pedobacter sp. GR22-6 TaxID=3127957 RepID=UPI00307F2131
MKTLFIIITFMLLGHYGFGQRAIEDEAIRYQQERMVFKQWDRGKFEPGSGWLGINPYYWLTWGLHPNYPDTDRRPLSAWGPQTQRLGMVGLMNSASDAYKLEADTLRNTSLLEVSNFSGALSAADPLWILYYSKELKPVMEHNVAEILAAVPAPVRGKILSEELFDWYKNELEILRERVNGARTGNMDRGSRILAYHRLLGEYRTLAATWATRTANAEHKLKLGNTPLKLKNGEVNINSWTSSSDVGIAREVIRSRKY